MDENVFATQNTVASTNVSIQSEDMYFNVNWLLEIDFAKQKPAELVQIFSRIDGIELENIVHRNTEWIRLTHGLLYYYGVMDVWLIKEKVKQLTGQEMTFWNLRM